MNIQSAKLIINCYGNVALTRKSYIDNKKDFDKFLKEYGGEIKEFPDDNNIIIINCENYVMPEDEKDLLHEKMKKRKESGILTQKQLDEMIKDCLKENKEKQKAFEKVQQKQIKCRKKQ